MIAWNAQLATPIISSRTDFAKRSSSRTARHIPLIFRTNARLATKNTICHLIKTSALLHQTWTNFATSLMGLQVVPFARLDSTQIQFHTNASRNQ